MTKKIYTLAALACISFLSADGRTYFLEYKGAAFIPVNKCLRSIFGKAAFISGPELTFQLHETNKKWYGFASIDYMSKHGRSAGLCEPTKMHVVPLGFGAKYCGGRSWGTIYGGLGLQAIHLKTINCSTYVAPITSRWGYGAIAKFGGFIDLRRNFFVDLFADFSFGRIRKGECCNNIIPEKVCLSGAILGGGIGYRFN